MKQLREPPLVAPSLGDDERHAERNARICEWIWTALLVASLSGLCWAVAS